jgi:hypothetical protein
MLRFYDAIITIYCGSRNKALQDDLTLFLGPITRACFKTGCSMKPGHGWIIPGIIISIIAAIEISGVKW